MAKPLILFDMDGTLIIQSEKPRYIGTITQYNSYISIKQQMKEIVVQHGVPAEIVMDLNRMAHIWNTTRHYFEDNGYSEKQIQKVIDEINVPFMEEERADHAVSVLIPGTIEGLESLQRLGYEMGLVTTASRESYDRISIQEKYGCFGEYYKYSVTRDDCKYIKPEPEPIFRMLINYEPSDFVYIGDSDHDSQASRAAGGKFVLINTREYDSKVLKELSPDAIINSINELPEVLSLLK
jgi:HAD superfamily hydrolase (TIGR01549 family)